MLVIRSFTSLHSWCRRYSNWTKSFDKARKKTNRTVWSKVFVVWSIEKCNCTSIVWWLRNDWVGDSNPTPIRDNGVASLVWSTSTLRRRTLARPVRAVQTVDTSIRLRGIPAHKNDIGDRNITLQHSYCEKLLVTVACLTVCESGSYTRILTCIPRKGIG